MNVPITNTGDHMKNRRIARYMWVTWIWMAFISAVVIWTFLRYAPAGTTTEISKDAVVVPSAPVEKKKRFIKIYPFNIYDDTQNRIVRYPSTGGIPDLTWKSVKHFRACCRDDYYYRCFSTNEIALRRDISRTQRGLPDVYMEIRQNHPTGDRDWKAVGTVGSRCQLIWSIEKADVEK